MLKLIYLDSELAADENEESLLHELQHAIQHNEHFTFGATHVYWQRRIDEGLKKKSTKTGKPMTASELYKNTAGEIEARDVTKRRGMPEEERKVTLPDTGDADTLQVKGTDAGAESLTSDGDGDIIREKYVSTGGLRNETPLTIDQIKENVEYAERLGMPKGKIRYSENCNTAYGEVFDMLHIGTDVYPSVLNIRKANSRVSNKGAIAHEIVGHRESKLKGCGDV